MRRLKSAASLFLTAVLFAVMSARAQSIADRLPEGTLIYMEATGIGNVSAFPTSHAGQLFLSAEMQKLHAAVFPTLIKLAEKEGDAEAISGLKLLSQLTPALLRDGGAMYLSSLDVNGPRGGLVLKAQGKPLFDQFPDVFMKAMEQDNVRLRQVGDYAVMGVGYPASDAVLPEAALSEKSLAGSEKFKAAFGGFTHEPVFRIYVDVAGLHRAISAMADIPEAEQLREYPQVAEVLGLSSAGTLAISTGVNGKNWRTEATLTATGARGVLGLLSEQAAKPLQSEISDVVKAIPADATHATLAQFDAARFLESVRGLVEAHAPQHTEQFNSYLGLASQTLGTDIPKEVLPHLGATWALYRAPQIGGTGVYGTVLVNRLRDPAKAAAGLEKLGQGINRTLLSVSQTPAPRFTFRSSTIDGVSVRTLPLALLNLSVVVQGDYLIVGVQPQTAVAAAKFVSSPQATANLGTSASYKAALARLGAPETASSTFIDLPVFAATGYQNLIFLSNALGAGGTIVGADVPVALLPPYYKVAGMFSADVSAWWADEKGLYFKAETPFPGAFLVSDELAGMGLLQLMGATGMLARQAGN